MTAKSRVLNYLKEDIRFRERKNKNRGIANLLIEEYPWLGQYDKEKIIDILVTYATYNRQWCRLLQQREELRGQDYNDKFHLQEEAQERFGYGYPKVEKPD